MKIHLKNLYDLLLVIWKMKVKVKVKENTKYAG